jgi:hypothetical protein
MATQSNYALRLPTSLMADVRIASENDGTSINAFIVQAVAEKIALLRARGLLEPMGAEQQQAVLAERARRSRPGSYTEILNRAGKAEPLPGDEIPQDYFDGADAPATVTSSPL